MRQLEFCLRTEHETVLICECFHQACISFSVGINLTKSFFYNQSNQNKKEVLQVLPSVLIHSNKNPCCHKKYTKDTEILFNELVLVAA